jgi:hypothetical protein
MESFPSSAPPIADAKSPEAVAQVLVPPAAPAIEPLASNPIEGLEISNGVGERYLARRTARGLSGLGIVASRVTDYSDFKQGRTRIMYRPGHLEAARALRQALPGEVTLVRAPKGLAAGVNVRLVLGRDLAAKRIFAWADSPDVVTRGVQAEWSALLGRPVDLSAYADSVSRVIVEDGWRWS